MNPTVVSQSPGYQSVRNRQNRTHFLESIWNGEDTHRHETAKNVEKRTKLGEKRWIFYHLRVVNGNVDNLAHRFYSLAKGRTVLLYGLVIWSDVVSFIKY